MRIIMHHQYWNMVDRWKGIVAKGLGEDAVRDACMAILHEFVSSLADNRVGQENAALRFYADMHVLQAHLAPLGVRDDLARLAVHPARALVEHWLQENAHLSVAKGHAGDFLSFDRMKGTIFAP
jgi:hypothetical protein